MSHQKTLLLALGAAILISGGIYIIKESETRPETPSGNVEKQISPKNPSPTENKPSSSNSSPSAPSSSTAPKSSATQTQGARLIFAIKDDTAPLDDISSVLLSITEISIHSPKKGWVSVSNELRTYDLLRLKRENRLETMLDIQAEEETYNQLRLTVGSVVIMKGGITSTAKLPSGTIHIPFSLPVKNKQLSAVTLDFSADKSLHLTGNNEYVFAPVLNVNTFSQIEFAQKLGSKVEFIGGYPRFAGNFGMDENGNIKSNSDGIDSLSRIETARNVFVLIPHSITRGSLAISPESAIDAALSKAYLTGVRSVHAVMIEKNPTWEVLGIINGKITNVFIDGVTGTLIKIE